MKKIRYILYFSNSNIYFFDKKKNQMFSDFFFSLKNDEVINKQEFTKEFNKFLLKNKIKLSIFGNKVIFITNYDYTNFYKFNLQELLLEYFKSVTFVNVTDFLNISNKVAYLNITDNYIDYYYFKITKKHQRLMLSLFNNSILKAYNHFLSIYKPKKIYIYGNNLEIPKISNQLSKEQAISVIFVENYATYVIKSFLDFKCCKTY